MRNKTNGPLWEEYLNRARRALRDGEPDIAITHAEQVLLADPENVQARVIREEATALKARTRSKFSSFIGKIGASAARMTGLGKQAIDELRMQHRADTTDWRAAVAYAEACLQSNLPSEGVSAYLAALSANQTNERFLESAANFFQTVGDAEHEVAVLRMLRQYRDSDPVLERRLRNAEANLMYQVESKHKPKETRAEKEKAKTELVRDQDLRKRIEQAVKVFREHPEDMRNRVWLARLLVEAGGSTEIEDARQVRGKVIEEDPENTDGVRVLADLHRGQGELKEATDLYEKLKEMRPDDPEIRDRVVEVREEYFRARIGEDPEDTEAQEGLKEIEQDRAERQIHDLEQKIKMNPNNPDLLIDLGDVLRKRDRLDDAISRYQAASRNPTRRFRATMRLGEAFVAKEKPELAVLQFEKALEAAPAASHGLSRQKKEALYALGCAHQELGEIEKALEFLQQIYADDIGYQDVSERFESLYAAKREREEAS